VAVFELHAKHGVGQGLENGALEFDRVVLRHAVPGSQRGPRLKARILPRASGRVKIALNDRGQQPGHVAFADGLRPCAHP
jgi:hypothetical protein